MPEPNESSRPRGRVPVSPETRVVADGTSVLYRAHGRGTAAAGDTTLARRLTADTDRGSTRAALDEGSLSTEHAKVVAKALYDLPDGLSPAERARVGRRPRSPWFVRPACHGG